MLTDTHCHLDFPTFDPDRSEVLERAAEAGLTRLLVPGLTVDSSRRVIALAGTHPQLYAAVGVHPTEAGGWNADSIRLLQTLAVAPGSKVVAIGEIGLDYYWEAAPHALQQAVLKEQLELARELGLPVILHLREARGAGREDCARDLLFLLRAWVEQLGKGTHARSRLPGVLHSFSGSLQTAREALALGFFIGITGPVTFENARERQALVRELPLERLLLETDAPFLAPHPQRGRRNEPAYIRLIADKIALLHTCSLEQVARVTSENAHRLFGWDSI